MSAIVWKLAWTEFRRSFARRAPGGRDLLWLTLLLAGVQLLALVLMTAREGVLERSVDAFLGSEPGYGVPVWVLPNALGSPPTRSIEQGVLDELDAAGFPVAPYRRFRADSTITMPGNGLWAPRGAGGLSDAFRDCTAPRFAGLSAKVGGPHWPDATPAAWAEDTGAWKIALDHDLFAACFDLAAYRKAVEGRIPDASLKAVPKDAADVRRMTEIWLNVRVHTEQLTRFEIVWGINLGVGSQPSAFVAPVKLNHMIDLARRHPPEMCFFVEDGPVMGRRVLEVKSAPLLLMKPEERDAAIAAFVALNERIPGDVEGADGSGLQVSISFGTVDDREAFARGARCDPGVAESRLTAIADELQVPYDRANPGMLVPATNPVRIDDRQITVPADTVMSETKGESTRTTVDGVESVSYAVAAGINGYPEALVFARNRLQLFELIAYLKCEPAPGYAAPRDRTALCNVPAEGADNAKPSPRLIVNPIYTDALTRFSFLSELIDKLRTPLGVILVTLLIAVLFVQLGTVIGHRKVRYGMMISNGLTWGQVRLLLMIQVAIGAILALAVATLATIGMQLALAPGLGTLSQRFRSVTDGRVLEALPLSAMDVVLVGAMAIITSVLLARFLLWFTGVSSRKPMDRLLR